MPLARRIAATFLAPARLFAYLRTHAPFFDVLVLTTVIAAVVAAAQPDEVYLDRAVDPVTRRGEPVTLTSEPAEIVRWGRILAALSAIPGHPLIALAIAGLLLLAFRVIGRGEATFPQYLSLTAHALLIAAAGSLAVLAAQWATGRPSLSIGPGLFLDADAGGAGWAMNLLAGLDVFTIWTIAVLAAGVAALNRHRSWLPPLLVLGGIYLVLLVVTSLALA